MMRNRSARTVGLSVHTINERLRDARRKLDVPSSREAARLLFDAEGDPPKMSRDTIIGEGTAGGDEEHGGGAGRTSRLRRMVIGATVMTFLLGLIALAALPQSGASPNRQAAEVETSDPAIIATARRFVELLDEDNWTETYRMMGAPLQKLNSAQVWSSVSERVRAPLGPVQSRELMSEQNLPAPPAGYEVVKFRTTFANKANAVETVTLEHADGGWKVEGRVRQLQA